VSLKSVWETSEPNLGEPEPVTGHYDVVVVGGGLTGVCTALQLASAGKAVLVIEAQHVGAGTTGGSTAKVSTLQGTRFTQIARHQPSSVLADYVTANREGAEWLRRFCAEHGVATQARSACTYATTEEGADLVAREHSLASAVGLPVSLSVDVPSLPFRTTAAVELADQFQLDPLEMLAAMAREARARGATIVEGTRVTGVRGSNPVRVSTETGVATCDTVVLATNQPLLDRGAHFARLKPTRSYAVAYTAGDTSPLPGMYLSADDPSRSVRDAVLGEDRFLLVGGEGHTTGRAPAPHRRLDNLRSWTAEHFPGLRETHAWSAQDYLPAHGLPLVGPLLPHSDHLLVAGGYAKWGMTNAVAAALALTSRILGGRTDWADAMATWSRRELSGMPGIALYNAEVGVEMAKGWLAPLVRRGATPAEGEGVVQAGRRGPTAVARVDGVEQRVSGVCTHLGGVVRWNDAERSWDCPLHGSRFGPDGTVLEGPATCGLRRR
jgi:glycine/D-amino acid oxidase-like deaminating enzyme/nitrite reductase/ring-hydroxylating ferredoxin subunit